MCKETSLCDTVGFIVKFLRKQFIEITKFLLLKNLCMQSCPPVDRISGNNCKICHLHLSVVENCHLAHFLLIIRIFCTDLFYKTAVDLIHDLIYTRKQSLEDVDRPLFKCLCHDGMVGVCTGMRCDIPCFFPGHSFFVQQDTHQFGNRHGRMGIIHLERYLLWQIMQIIVMFLKTLQRTLDTCGNKEILLF